MRNSVESLLGESYSLNKLHYKKAARAMHCKVLFIIAVCFMWNVCMHIFEW